jgi:hypothetical protein
MSRLTAAVLLMLAPAAASAQSPIPAAPVVAAPTVAAPAPVAAPVIVAAPVVVAAPAPVAVAAPAAAPAPVVAPAPVAAPQVVNPADGECVTTTTTTTRCTGAAAPYAAQPAAPVVAAPVVVAPAPPQQQQWIPVQLPSGWTLHQDPDGSLWRERHHRGNASLWVPGLVMWLGTYVVGEAVGLGSGQPFPMLPLLGDFIAAGTSDDAGAKIGWAVTGIAQLGGFVMFIAGAVADGKTERLPVTIAPAAFYGGGSGVAVTGRF